MAGFKVWDVVAVPFPYTDRPARERRPALVIGAEEIQEGHGLLWVLMITSAANRGWPGDVAVSDLRRAGLPALSVIRTAKIATIEAKEAQRLGSIPAADRAKVGVRVSAILDEASGASLRKGGRG